MKVFARTDVGRVRPINEDAYYLPMEGECFCAIADGMGGHNAGEVASAMAVQVFSDEMRNCAALSGDCMRAAVERANLAIFQKSLQADQCSGMGTTFTAVALNDGRLHIAHVGDSRAYLLRGENIMRLTVDHTLVEEMVMKGLITPSAAKVHPKRNYITRALGTGDQVEVDLTQVEAQPGDIIFLCTDGLTNHVKDQFILETGRGEGSWQDKLETLVQTAMANGSTDNITAMFAVFEDNTEDNK